MKIITNSGEDRVLDELRANLKQSVQLDITTPAFSLFAFSELRLLFNRLKAARLILPPSDGSPGEQPDVLGLLGTTADRPFRNQLQNRWLAQRCIEWLNQVAEVRQAPQTVPMASMIISEGANGNLQSQRALSGTCAFTTDGLGLTPGNQLGLVQVSENPTEAAMLASWFGQQWQALGGNGAAKNSLLKRLKALAQHPAPSAVYDQVLYHLFKDIGEELNEERIVKSGTGIRQTIIWQKLYRFQRDAVLGAIDKLERHGGCIIADSVGLGKTFEALAIIKYYELRNDRVLVLCPKRLRDNWTLYKVNDVRNALAADRLHYDVLNHTDLSREEGESGDIDLKYVNWGNYDLVVIDESHNFRNKKSPKQGGETRYDRLMRQIIQKGVRTRVLMLSATPVNNRLADLRNQIAFITEANDEALSPHGITSIQSTVRQAQLQFNRWLDLPEAERQTSRLLDMLGFDYFRLLDLLSIARSRKHIEKYYGTQETGSFPERCKPINIKSDVDLAGQLQAIHAINRDITKLHLAAYAPLSYVLPHRQKAYDDLYSTQIRGGESIFRQVDRERSMLNLLRVNLLKRMESSVASFAQTLERQLADVDRLLLRLDNHEEAVEEIDLEDIDFDDPRVDPLLVGRKVRVLLQDVDRIRWRQDLAEDRNRLATLLDAARAVNPTRDAKLKALREVLKSKVREPLNPGNRKVIVFTAFADTAAYLYDQLAAWAREELGLYTSLVTGTGRNRTNLPNLRADLTTLLTAFSPRSRERPATLADEGELDLLIATDCISEGQNLQDCDTLINYDIHWNPVRIIQRFGRIDRLGSPNTKIQLVNFWPNMELEEYINLEQRVSGRMVLLDISATGEENLIVQEPDQPMNDLEYRRQQLLSLQETVVDLEDLAAGLSITDLTLNDFRMDLAAALRKDADALATRPLGAYAVVSAPPGTGEGAIPPGVIFCLRAETDAARANTEPGYPLSPHYLVHVPDDATGATLLPYSRTKQVLDRLRRLCLGRDLPDATACVRFDRLTRHGEVMDKVRAHLATAVASIIGRKEERAAASIFQPGGTHALRGEFAGINDFEVIAFVVVLPAEEGGAL